MRKLLAGMVVGMGATVVLGRKLYALEHSNGRPHAENNQQAEAAVAQVEQLWLDALERADIGAIADMLADDFVRPAPQAGRFINKAELLDYYRAHLIPEPPGRKRIENMTVAVFGNTAIARGTLIATDAAGHVTAELLFTDLFVRRNGRWLAASAQENPAFQP